MITRRPLGLLIVLCTLTGCTKQPEAQAPDPQTILQAIPPADSGKYQRIRDMKNWQNPYLIVRADGVALYDVADSAEIVMKPDELLPALAKLPASNWPYGRVVAAAEVGVIGSEQQKIATAYIAQMTAAHLFSKPIVTQVVPLKGFYDAESYHQDYATNHPDNPYIQVCDRPKIETLKREFPELFHKYKGE